MKPEDLLNQLKAGTSVFRFIPKGIGQIVYCDSSNPNSKADSKLKTVIKSVLTVLCSLVVLFLCVVLFHDSVITLVILGAFIILITIFLLSHYGHFLGTDYFIGTEGFSLVSFEKTRDNVAEMSVLFADVDLITISEKEVFDRRRSIPVYDHTSYHCNLCKGNGASDYEVLYEFDGSYHKQNLKKPGAYDCKEYRFIKTIEEKWSTLRFEKMKPALDGGESIGFTCKVKGKDVDDYIVVGKKQIRVGETAYDYDSIKRVGFKKDCFVIEDINHESGFLGIGETGEKSKVDKEDICNCTLFVMILNYYMKKYPNVSGFN